MNDFFMILPLQENKLISRFRHYNLAYFCGKAQNVAARPLWENDLVASLV